MSVEDVPIRDEEEGVQVPARLVGRTDVTAVDESRSDPTSRALGRWEANGHDRVQVERGDQCHVTTGTLICLPIPITLSRAPGRAPLVSRLCPARAAEWVHTYTHRNARTAGPGSLARSRTPRPPSRPLPGGLPNSIPRPAGYCVRSAMAVTQRRRSCLSLVWAVLDRASPGWRGVDMNPHAVRLLQDLRRELFGPPTERKREEVIDEAVVPAA